MEPRLSGSNKKATEMQSKAIYPFIGLLSPEGILVEANPMSLLSTGLEASEVIGKPLWETYWWNYSTEVQTQLKQAITSAALGQRVQYEVFIKGKRSKKIPIDFSLEPIFNTEGQLKWIFSEGSDTALKHDEEVQESKYQQLQASHNSLKSIIDSASDLIGAIDSNYCFTLYNQAYQKEIQELFGVKIKRGMKIHQVIRNHPEYLEDALVLWGSALKGNAFTVTRMYNHPGVTLAYYEYKFNPIFDTEGSVIGAVQVVRNQTEKIKAQQKVKNIKEFILLAEVIPQKVWSAHPDGRVDYVNNRFLEYTGLYFEQMMDSGWENMVHPEDQANTIQNWQESMQTGKTYEVEYRLRSRDGEYQWHLGRSIPMLNSEGRIIKWMGTATNIHKRKLLEQEIKEKVQEFEFLVDVIPHIVWKALPTGEVVFYNKKWVEFTGIPQEEGAKGLWKMIPHPDDRDRTLEAWQRSMETGETYKIEHRIASKDGTYRWLQSHALPLKDNDGKIVMWFGTATDIHEEKTYLEELVWMQKQLQERNKELTRVNVDLDNFVYTASHDLRTPILNLGSLQNLLEEQIEIKAGSLEETILKMMKQSVNRLENTINELSEIAKLQKEKEKQENLSFHKMYQEVYQDLENLIMKSEAKVFVDFQEKQIFYTPKHLRSVLHNLFSNAIKYAAPERKPIIGIRTFKEDEKICLTVSDNGLGLEKRQQDRLFQMFTRLHSHVEGTGIGLYMIKRIIENNGGSIQVESKPREGTTFTVIF